MIGGRSASSSFQPPGHDIQHEWARIRNELSEKARSDTERVTAKGSELFGGMLGKFGATLMEVGVEQGMNLTADFSATRTVAVEDLARIVLAVRAGIGDLDRDVVGDIYRTLIAVEHAMSRDIGDVKRRGNSSYEANKHLLLVRATVEMIQGDSGRGPGMSMCPYSALTSVPVVTATGGYSPAAAFGGETVREQGPGSLLTAPAERAVPLGAGLSVPGRRGIVLCRIGGGRLPR